MIKRTITTILGIAVLLPVLYFSGTLLFPVAVSVFCLIALFEIFRCIGSHKNIAVTLPLYIVGATAPFAVRYLPEPRHFTGAALLIFILLVLYMLTIIVLSKNKINLTAVAAVLFSGYYIIFSFCGIIYLRDLQNGYIYLLIFISAWVTDIFAYLSGVLFGKHKLLPEISPKKTVEGSIGGAVFSAAAFSVTAMLIGLSYIGLPLIITCGILVSCIAQVGDLSMSAVKRQFGIKDFGNLFPGHGGVLDRFDSILAVSSVMTIIFALIKIFAL